MIYQEIIIPKENTQEYIYYLKLVPREKCVISDVTLKNTPHHDGTSLMYQF
jgi:hypothetical protein